MAVFCNGNKKINANKFTWNWEAFQTVAVQLQLCYWYPVAELSWTELWNPITSSEKFWSFKNFLHVFAMKKLLEQWNLIKW